MAKKLGITIAGAVSLGSYESGVVFEIPAAIAQHNLWADAQNPPTERFEVDVLTGASAGGMTVAMLAQRLLYDGDSLNDPYNNPLYTAWVKQVHIDGLLPLRTFKPAPPRPSYPSAYLVPEPASNSLLSSDCVIDISLSSITDRYSTNPPPPQKPHAALTTDSDLFVGLSLSNLSGVDYERHTQSGNEFVYTAHEDQFLCQLHPANADTLATWEPIRSAAVSCGAFPFAFRAQDLLRTSKDYPAPISALPSSPWAIPEISPTQTAASSRTNRSAWPKTLSTKFQAPASIQLIEPTCSSLRTRRSPKNCPGQVVPATIPSTISGRPTQRARPC